MRQTSLAAYDSPFRHLDIFSGIGGFSLAASRVWLNHQVIAFVEIDPFCQAVLRKHWPGVKIIGDVRDVTEKAISDCQDIRFKPSSVNGRDKEREDPKEHWKMGRGIDLLTGGFPCQPFSCAGKRRGTEDDRWLWPETFRVIREFYPRWVILENVRGLISLKQGMVFDNLLSELESIGYTVQSFVIPACAVDAPHRRDRVWICAHSVSLNDNRSRHGAGPVCGQWGQETKLSGSEDVANTPWIQPGREDQRPIGKRIGECGEQDAVAYTQGCTVRSGLCPDEPGGIGRGRPGESGEPGIVADADHSRRNPGRPSIPSGREEARTIPRDSGEQCGGHSRWLPEPGVGLCDDGLSSWMAEHRRRWADGTWEQGIPRVATGVKNRVNKLKALGNSVVPAVVFQIMNAIKEVDSENDSFI